MVKEIDCYINRHYYTLLGICKKITKKDEETSRELLHEVMLQIYQRDNIELKSYDDDSIRYYITSICRINYYSNTSPYHYRIRKDRQMFTDLSEAYHIEAEQENFEKEIIFTILEESYCNLSWFHKSLFDLYMGLQSLNKVSKQTTIPLRSIARYIKEAKDQIKDETITKLKRA